MKTVTILTIAGRAFSLRKEFSHGDLASLLCVLEGAQPTDEKWTPDYDKRGMVVEPATQVSIALFPVSSVFTQEAWEALCEKHPRKEGQP